MKALDNPAEMAAIYATCKAVYEHQISVNAAVDSLEGKTQTSAASRKMYFNIYKSMRHGTCYKMGTSATFTKYLLDNIFLDDGLPAFRKAAQAVKYNSQYRKSVDNEQPGIEYVCREAIREHTDEFTYDDLLDYQEGPKQAISKATVDRDYGKLLQASSQKNALFSQTIMEIAESHQLFSGEDIALLCSREECRRAFSCDYSILLPVSKDEKYIDLAVRDQTGRPRYYKNPYHLNNAYYVMSSQLYGAESKSHRDNRTPFLSWVIQKYISRYSLQEGKPIIHLLTSKGRQEKPSKPIAPQLKSQHQQKKVIESNTKKQDAEYLKLRAASRKCKEFFQNSPNLADAFLELGKAICKDNSSILVYSTPSKMGFAENNKSPIVYVFRKRKEFFIRFKKLEDPEPFLYNNLNHYKRMYKMLTL